jgi:hypothetical protein
MIVPRTIPAAKAAIPPAPATFTAAASRSFDIGP